MKLIIFDVGNAACSIIASPNKYGMMIDCGCSGEKENPVDLYYRKKKWLELIPYMTKSGKEYELGLLHVTHPDDDHVRNARRIKVEIPPYLLLRRRSEEFSHSESINQDYKAFIDREYRGSNGEIIPWGFDEERTFSIPLDTIKNDEILNKKIKNNSSILRYVECHGIKILFSGDLERAGWEWLANNDTDFADTMKKGLDILIAPHHGHISGFPKCLFDLTGNVRTIIHSKGSEGKIIGTDVSNQYSKYADGVIYTSLNDNCMYKGKILTTRSNGNIHIQIDKGSYRIWTDKASSNHERY